MYYSLLFRIIRRGNSKKSSYSWPQNTQPLVPDTLPDNIANLEYKVSEFGVFVFHFSSVGSPNIKIRPSLSHHTVTRSEFWFYDDPAEENESQRPVLCFTQVWDRGHIF